MITIVGTGAMACLFAARLAAAGNPVAMLGSWPAGLAALREHGVRILDQDGQTRAYPITVCEYGACEDFAQSNGRDCVGNRFAIVLVKSWQTARAAEQLVRCLPQDGLALTLQNGLGNQEVLAEALGWERVALGVATLGAHLLEPGLLKAAGSGAVSLSANPRLAPLAEVLRSAGLPVETVADPLSLLWGKLVINAAINPLTALLRVPNGALLARPSARSLMADLAREAAEVAAALGIRLPYPDPVEAVAAVARKTADNRSSMLQDVLRGAPTEVDAICGAIARTGDTVGIRTPTNRVLCRLVSALSSSEIAQRDWKETVSESRQA